MKYILSAFAVIGFLGSSAMAQTSLRPGDVKITKVLPSVVKTPEFQVTGGQNKRYKLGQWLEVEVEFETKPEDIEELTFRYTVLVEKKLLDGEVTHVNIPKGRDHYSVMYISPRSLEKLTDGKALSPASIENVWVEVSRSGQVLHKESLKPGLAPNLQHLAGMILNKSETPFAPLYFDRYEAIKHQR
jgi:hypothetical protein